MSKSKKNKNSETPQNPKVALRGQFIRDLSFENPKSPKILFELKEAPQIDIRINVSAGKVDGNLFESIIDISCTAQYSEKNLFVIELTYGGVFEIENIPEDQLSPLLLIYCPSLIFPFARRVIADLSRDGGFQPLMIEPVDFAAMYQQSMERSQNDN